MNKYAHILYYEDILPPRNVEFCDEVFLQFYGFESWNPLAVALASNIWY